VYIKEKNRSSFLGEIFSHQRSKRKNAMAKSGSAGLAVLSAGLARCLAEENTGSNLVFSPLSIYVALALLAAGAGCRLLKLVYTQLARIQIVHS
jgi:hypothetical protein